MYYKCFVTSQLLTPGQFFVVKWMVFFFFNNLSANQKVGAFESINLEKGFFIFQNERSKNQESKYQAIMLSYSLKASTITLDRVLKVNMGLNSLISLSSASLIEEVNKENFFLTGSTHFWVEGEEKKEKYQLWDIVYLNLKPANRSL